MLPHSHHSFINHLISIIRHDIRVDALLGGGSLVHGGFDEYPDLDFIIVIKDEYYDEIQSDKQKFAKNVGTRLNAFTGDHVGEPRLLICLYGPPLLHVDLKFITLDMLSIALKTLSSYLVCKYIYQRYISIKYYSNIWLLTCE